MYRLILPFAWLSSSFVTGPFKTQFVQDSTYQRLASDLVLFLGLYKRLRVNRDRLSPNILYDLLLLLTVEFLLLGLELLLVVLSLFTEGVQVVEWHRAGICNEDLTVVGNGNGMVGNCLKVDVIVVNLVIGLDFYLVLLVLIVLIRNGTVLLNGLID